MVGTKKHLKIGERLPLICLQKCQPLEQQAQQPKPFKL